MGTRCDRTHKRLYPGCPYCELDNAWDRVFNLDRALREACAIFSSEARTVYAEQVELWKSVLAETAWTPDERAREAGEGE